MTDLLPTASAHRSTEALTASLDLLRAAPADIGTLRMVVRRPVRFGREILNAGRLDTAEGLVGDNWLSRATSVAIAEGRHLEAQLNVMSARMVGLLGETAEEMALAGDQLFLDLDISVANLPTGSRLAIGDGDAAIEVTAKPHNGCAKFVARYGEQTMRFVNSEAGKALRLRGFNARVVDNGEVRPGDAVRVIRRGPGPG